MLGVFNYRSLLSALATIVGGAQSLGADGGLVANGATLYSDLACSIQPISGDQVPEYAKAGDVVSDHVLITDQQLTVPNGALVTCGGNTYRVVFASDAGGRGNGVGVVTELFLRLIQ